MSALVGGLGMGWEFERYGVLSWLGRSINCWDEERVSCRMMNATRACRN